MKRLIAAVLALAMTAAMAMTAMAVNVRLFVKDDDGYFIDEVTTPAPGQTVYALLTDGDKPNKMKASHDIEVISQAKDRKVSLIGGSSFSIVKKKIGSSSSDYAYFAEIKIKDVGSSAYEEDGYHATGEITYENSAGNEFTYDVDFYIEYPEGYDELTDELQIFSYEKDDDIDLELPDGESTFEAEASGNSKVLASMSTDYDGDFANRFSNANLDFYYGNGATFDRLVRSSAVLTIYAREGSYLYEIKSGGALTDLSKTYDDYEEAFVVKSNSTSFTLGKYVVSDIKLSGAAAASSSSSAASVSSSVSSTPGGTYVPVNPNTGAAA
jgi:hypothetical protein